LLAALEPVDLVRGDSHCYHSRREWERRGSGIGALFNASRRIPHSWSSFPVQRLAWLPLVVVLLTGCQQGGSPFLLGQSVQNNAAPGGLAANNPLLAGPSPESQAVAAQLQDAQRRLSQLDASNRELTAQIAQAQQIMQSEREQKRLIQQQLAEAGGKLREVITAKDEVERRASALYASQRQVGGATITANSSIRSSLRTADVAGLEVRQEGTTIRVEVPADRLFTPGTSQLLPQGSSLLDDIAASITRNYPRQLLVVEGHTDNSPAISGTAGASHQLSAGQAHMVLDYLITQRRMPPNQISSMAFGAYRPRVSNATPEGQRKNRRVEIVIYPDTVDGKP
jgi:flagellar motor protein MotB